MQYSSDHNGKPPTILIDLKEISHVLVQHDEIGLILGGKYDHYNKMMKIFLENLQRTKAELVFFHAGKKYTDDIEFFIPKQEDDYMNCIEILNKIEEQSDLRAYLVEKNKLSQDIRMTLSFQYNLLKLVRRFGTVQINYVRHNQEIAKYANEHSDDVLAVISNDTDFMAFDGDFQYWPANTINIRQLSGKRYCKYKLRDKLGLNPWQIQLLSALSGSNFLPYYIIKEWTIQLTTENGLEKRGRIWNVSHYVKNQTYEIVNNEAQFDLNKISGDVFGPDYTPAQLNSIANGLACYDLNIKSEIDERDAFVKFTKNHNWFIYKMITDDIFKIRCIEYIDFRNYKSKNYAELVLPILKKLFGILYKDNRHRPGSHQICMKHAHDEPYKLTEVNIVYPPSKWNFILFSFQVANHLINCYCIFTFIVVKLPPLFDLIFKNKERQFDQFRWSLCEWILDLDKGFMKNLSDKKKSKFFACILTLKYLVQVLLYFYSIFFFACISFSSKSILFKTAR